MQISIEIALQITANAVVVAMAFARLDKKIAVLQTEIVYLKRALRIRGTIPADL